MNGILKKIGKGVAAPFLGKARFQGIFDGMHRLALAGMNLGRGRSAETSGEIHLLRVVRDTFAGSVEKPVIFDVGANVGEYTGAVLDIFGHHAVVYSFEPSRSTFERLRERFGGAQNVRLFNIALGDREGEATLYAPGEGSKLASLHARNAEHLDVRMHPQEVVGLTTVDSFCAANDIGHIHFMKIDVEGNEYAVLEGSSAMIARGDIDFIQFEFGACDVDARIFFKDFFYLLNDRYVIYRTLQDGLFPVHRYAERWEVFERATNYAAVRRGVRVEKC